MLQMMDPSQIATIILAGGKGTRLHPLTLNHCKPAISFGGRYRLIDIPLSNSLHSNLNRIYVLAQYLSGELQHHINQTYRFGMFNNGSIDVLTPQENEKGEKNWFEGTADAVRKTLTTILKSEASYFLILSGDQLYHLDFSKMATFANDTQADITIATTPVHHSQSERFGILRVDEGKRATEFIEKPRQGTDLSHLHLSDHFFQQMNKPSPKEPHLLASMGIYLFKKEALLCLLESNSRADFGRDLFASALNEWKVAAYVYDGYWEDIGTIRSYYEASLLLTTNQSGIHLYDENKPIYTRESFLPGPKVEAALIRNSILSDGSHIHAAEINHCIIGMRSHVKKGTVLKDTILLGNHFQRTTTSSNQKEAQIGENCRIEGAIIDENVYIGNNVVLINQSGRQHYDGEGVFIREGIILVTANTVVQDHFIL